MQIRKLAWLTLAFAPSLMAAGVEPGQWEFTVRNEMEGMPPQQHPLKLTKCIAKANAANLLRVVPLVPGATPDNCELSNQKTSGSKTTFTLACVGNPKVSGESEVHLAAGSLSGSTKSLLDATTYKKHLNQSFTGKRLGECK